MKLTRLELLGFKSFHNRTVFNFADGVTALVGPNGCGKSNIVDAMIWVLGERGTKSLRVKEMGDVIFHGSNGRRPINMAEVTLGLSSGDSEYAIKRRVFRDGTNEYFINDKQVRLKDIQDFFLGTGLGLYSYAVVEQGNIEYFMQMKSQERRVLVEEASGITRFQEKKKEAFSRMEEVRANLERVEDLSGELEKNFKRAEEEWERLRAYNSLKDRLKDTEIILLSEGLKKVGKRLQGLEGREAELGALIEKTEEQRRAVKGRVAAKDDEIALTDQVVRQLELDIKGNEKDAESRVLELQYLENEKVRLHKGREELKAAGIQQSGKRLRYEEQFKTAMEAADHERKALHEDEERYSRLSAEKEDQKATVEAHNEKLEEERSRLFAAMSSLTDARNQIHDLERRTRERKAREEKRAEEEKIAHEGLTRLKEKKETLRTRLEKEKAEETRLGDEERALSEGLAEKQKEIESARNRIERLKGERQGKEEFLKKLTGSEKKGASLDLPFKRLIDTLSIPKELEALAEQFFAREMEYYVLEGACQAVSEHAAQHEGNFVFFHDRGFLRHEGTAVTLDIKAVESIAEALHRIDNGEEGVFSDGSAWVDSRGFVLKGKAETSISIRQFRERKRLEKETEELRLELERFASSLTEMGSVYGRSQQGLKDAGLKRTEAEKKRLGTEKELLVLATEIKVLEERLKEITSRMDLAEEIGLASLQELLDRRGACEKEKDAVEERLRLLKEEADRIRAGFEQISARLHDLALVMERSKASVRSLENEAERAKEGLHALGEEVRVGTEKALEIEKKLSEIENKIGGLEGGCEALGEARATLVARYEAMKMTFGNLHEEKTGLQTELDRTAEEQEKVRNRREAIDREKAVLQEKKDAIEERLRKEYGLENIDKLLENRESASEAEREELVRQIGEIGEINFRAEREYGEFKERLEFIRKQKEDLEQAMASLKKTIGKIDVLSRDLFLETFDKVSQSFQKFSQALFKGGKGSLALNEETGGIDLYVQPPGKRVTRMELLSGGEKALISLSFLLALMDTKASPFTLMDEIDAPLDDANLVSLLEIIRDISRKTMVVLITHNRITMESSDTIYGITMEEDGISKTISIKL